MDEEIMNELQEEIQNTSTSVDDTTSSQNASKSFTLECEGCFTTFQSNSEFVVLCGTCTLETFAKQSSSKQLDGVDNDSHHDAVINAASVTAALTLQNDSAPTILDDTSDSNKKADSGDVNHVDKNESASSSNTLPANTNTKLYDIGDYKVIESPDLFESNHPHYSNPMFTSSEDVYNYLHGVHLNKSTVEIQFTAHLNPITFEEDAYKKGDRANSNLYFTAVKHKEGNFENREYYSYINLVGFASKYNKRGYMCPSIIFEIDTNGKYIDTGERLVRLWRTRCPTTETWALIYKIGDDKVYLVKKGFFTAMKNRFTAIHLPFDYDKIIKR